MPCGNIPTGGTGLLSGLFEFAGIVLDFMGSDCGKGILSLAAAVAIATSASTGVGAAVQGGAFLLLQSASTAGTGAAVIYYSVGPETVNSGVLWSFRAATNIYACVD